MVSDSFRPLILALRNLDSLKKKATALDLSYALKAMPCEGIFPCSFFHNVEVESRLNGPEKAADALCDGLEVQRNNAVIVWLLVAADITGNAEIITVVNDYFQGMKESENFRECQFLIQQYRLQLENVKSFKANLFEKIKLQGTIGCSTHVSNEDKAEKFGFYYNQDGYNIRQELEDYIRNRVATLFDSASSTLMIFGAGGIGKSWVVRQSLTSTDAAKYFKARGVGSIGWLNVFEMSWQIQRFDYDAFYKELIKLFNVKTGNVPDNYRHDLAQYFRSTKVLKGKFMLILDDVFDEEVIEAVQGLEPDALRIICISRINFSLNFQGRGFMNEDPIEVKPMNGTEIRALISRRLSNMANWKSPNENMLGTVVDKIASVCFGLALLARVFSDSIRTKRKWENVLLHADNLNATFLSILEKSCKDETKEMSIKHLLLNDFEKREHNFKRNFMAFLMFEENSHVDIRDLAILWQTVDDEATSEIVKNMCDSSLVRGNFEMNKFQVHSLLYHAALSYACQPKTELHQEDANLYDGLSQFQLQHDNGAYNHWRMLRAIKRLRLNYISTMKCNYKTLENLFHAAIRQNRERLFERIEQAMIDSDELLFKICSQQTLKTKETPLHLLLECTDWFRNKDKDWERMYSLEKACYIAELLLQQSEKTNNKRALTLLNERYGFRGRSILQLLMLTTIKHDAPVRWQRNAFLVSAGNGYVMLMKLLLNEIITLKDNINDIVDVNGQNALMVAAENAQSNVICQLLLYRSKGQVIVDVNATDNGGRTILMISSGLGDDSSVEIVFQEAADFINVNQRDDDGYSALMYASKKSFRCVEILLNNGSQLTLKSNDGETALWLAVANGETKIASLLRDIDGGLLDGAEIQSLEKLCEYRNFTATLRLISSWDGISSGADSGLALLLPTGRAAQLDSTTTNQQLAMIFSRPSAIVELPENDEKIYSNAILMASYVGNYSVVKSLLERNQALVCSRNKYGWTPLMLASANGHVELLELFSMSIETAEFSDIKFKRTALIWASLFGHDRIVEKLITSFKCNVHAKDRYHVNALLRACQNGHLQSVQILVGLGKADVNSVDMTELRHAVDGVTPLMRAIKNGHVNVVKFLLSTGKVRPNVQNVAGSSAMIYAARLGNVEIGRMFLEYPGIDPNLSQNDGHTPLMEACTYGHCHFVELLLSYDVIRLDINTARIDGKTALSIASERNYVEITKQLFDNGADVNLCLK